MTLKRQPATLSLALHGVLKPGKPCLASGFVLDANDQPIGPAISGWITYNAPTATPARRGPKRKVLRKAAMLFAHLCFTNNDSAKRCDADLKVCEIFGYEDARSVKRVLAEARQLLPRGLIMMDTNSRMVLLFEGIPHVKLIPPDAIALTGSCYDWRAPELEAAYWNGLTLTLTTATRVDLERFSIELERFSVTPTDMAIIPRKSG
jgi:hypothetical protein